MPTTITISYAEALKISEPKEMHRALTKANNEGRHIGLTFDSDVKTAMLEISDTDGEDLKKAAWYINHEIERMER